jgi:hypothetical protein
MPDFIADKTLGSQAMKAKESYIEYQGLFDAISDAVQREQRERWTLEESESLADPANGFDIYRPKISKGLTTISISYPLPIHTQDDHWPK